jgi:hypothetical protein
VSRRRRVSTSKTSSRQTRGAVAVERACARAGRRKGVRSRHSELLNSETSDPLGVFRSSAAVGGRIRQSRPVPDTAERGESNHESQRTQNEDLARRNATSKSARAGARATRRKGGVVWRRERADFCAPRSDAASETPKRKEHAEENRNEPRDRHGWLRGALVSILGSTTAPGGYFGSRRADFGARGASFSESPL